MGDGDSTAVYSRFSDDLDADSTLDLKVRDRYGYGYGQKQRCAINGKMVCIVGLGIGLFVIGIVIGYFLHFNAVTHCDAPVQQVNVTRALTTAAPTEPPPVSNYSDMVASMIKRDTLDGYLQQYTTGAHYAGSPNSEKIINNIKKAWLDSGFEVSTKTYDVQLSRPNRTHPTKLEIIGGDESSIYYPNDQWDSTMLPAFNPYSANAEIEGDLVYLNYGGWKDYKTMVEKANIPVEGHICLVRLGKWSIPWLVRNCQKYGGIALVVFPDALHYSPEILEGLDPYSWWLPVNATIREPVRLDFGDPLTPFLPSLQYFNTTGDEEGVPRNVSSTNNFPVQVIGYEQARKYLTSLNLPPAPTQYGWQGVAHYNHTFKVGPGFADSSLKFKMTVNNVLKMQTITNIFGMMKGNVEPDRYVIIGNHRDSLTYGGVQPGSGTAILMEISRILGILYNQEGWRPRRTVLLASWDAGDDGNIGSAEWVEENAEVLRERAVAYINLDGAVEGNHTFSAAGSPLLTQIIYYATKRVNCPDGTHSNMKVYQNWKTNIPGPNGAKIEPLGFGNDAAPFLHVAGVPSLDLKYTYDRVSYKDLPTYPARHTAFDTYEYVTSKIDPSLKVHVAVTEVVIEALLALADDPLLNIEVPDYGNVLLDYYNDIHQMNETNFGPKNSLDYLKAVIQRFRAAAQDFHVKHYRNIDLTDEQLLRDINDRVMSIDRALTGDPGNFYLPQIRHVVFGPGKSGYDGDGFAPLKRAMWYYGKHQGNWESVESALSTTIARIDAAVRLLTDNPLVTDNSLLDLLRKYFNILG